MRVVDNVGFNVKKQDIPGGGNGQPLATPDWNQNDETAPDYIKNRAFYATDPVETVLVSGTFAFTFSGSMYYTSATVSDLVEGQTYKVALDGVEYETVCQNYNGSLYIGSIEVMIGGTPEYPFAYTPIDGSFITNIAGDSHDIVIKGSVSNYVTIPDNYIPKSVKATMLSIGDSGLAFSDTGEVVTFSDVAEMNNREIILKVRTDTGFRYHKCLCIETNEANKVAYLIFAQLSSNSSSFSTVDVKVYALDENGTTNM